MDTLPRLVRIELQGDTWFVLYSDRSKFQRHSAAQFSAKDHTLADVQNWVRSQDGIILSQSKPSIL